MSIPELFIWAAVLTLLLTLYLATGPGRREKRRAVEKWLAEHDQPSRLDREDQEKGN